MMDTILIKQLQDSKSLIDDLCDHFSCIQEILFQGTRRYYDSFDWRLYKHHMNLYSEGREYVLESRLSGSVTASCDLAKRPEMLSDFPVKSEIKKQLNSVLQMRALCRIFSIKLIKMRLCVVDDEQKTIVRIIIENAKTGRSGNFWLVHVIPLRGYTKQARAIHKWLTNHYPLKENLDLLDVVLATKRITPGMYSSKMNVQLGPELPVTQAAGIIHSYLLNIMQQNLDGIIKDIDTEFLHDFRVSVRRIRSLYSHLKKDLPPKQVSTARSDFTSLGKLTNRLRDIDVYLLNKDTYFSLLPEEMAPNIVPFFKMLADERQKEQKKLAKFLQSPAYKDIIKKWQGTLSQKNTERTNDPPVLEIARQNIIKYFNRVMKMGRAVTPDTPDSVLHKLRIECKKLRYILEFYASLFPSGLVPALIRQLKILQDNLGDFNDYSIQQYNLQEYIDGLPLNSQKNKKIITAVGFLIGKLNERQWEVRKDFARTFQRFSGQETLKIFEQIKMVH